MVVLNVGIAGLGCSQTLLSGLTLHQLHIHMAVKNPPVQCYIEDCTASSEQRASCGGGYGCTALLSAPFGPKPCPYISDLPVPCH